MKKRIKTYTIVLSVLIHIFLFIATDSAIKLNLLGFPVTKPEPVKTTPIVFDLQDKKKPRSVIESPDIEEDKPNPETSKYYSDKNLEARDSSASKSLPEKDPFSRGDIEAPVMPGKSLQHQIKKEKAEKSGDTGIKDKSDLSQTKVTPEKEVKKLRGLYNFHTDEDLMSENIESRVKKQGGFSFSTYNWNFAPYMLELKRKIQSNIFPPLAFKTLGLIDGETLLRFTIQRDGSLSNLKIINFKGHKSLMDTSLQAIKISAPFKKLPGDFPDKYLVVTGKFIYFIRK